MALKVTFTFFKSPNAFGQGFKILNVTRGDNLLVSVGHTGRRRVVLGPTLNAVDT